MKKIIDFMVAAYTLFMPQRYKEKRLEAGILMLNIPLIANGLALFFFVSSLFKNILNLEDSIIITFIYVIIPGIIIGFVVKKYLETNYLDKYEYIKTKFKRIPQIVLINIVVIHFLGSILLFFFCLRFLSFFLKP